MSEKTLSGQRVLKLYQMGNLHQDSWEKLSFESRVWWGVFAEEIERIVSDSKDAEIAKLRGALELATSEIRSLLFALSSINRQGNYSGVEKLLKELDALKAAREVL